MFKESYGELVRFVALTCGLDPHPPLEEPFNFRIQTVSYTLVYDEQIQADCAVSYCDFGELPKEKSSAVLYRLLEANLFMSTKDAAHFVINPETGHVLLKAQISLEKYNPPEIYNILVAHGMTACVWRDTYFLRGPDDDEMTGLSSIEPNVFAV